MSNQLLQYEAGQQSVPMTALTDSGDRKVFESDAEMFSKRSGFAPVVLPNGVLTGGQISVDAGVNDSVVVGNATANLNGVKRSEERRVGKECRARWTEEHEK